MSIFLESEWEYIYVRHVYSSCNLLKLKITKCFCLKPDSIISLINIWDLDCLQKVNLSCACGNSLVMGRLCYVEEGRLINCSKISNTSNVSAWKQHLSCQHAYPYCNVSIRIGNSINAATPTFFHGLIPLEFLKVLCQIMPDASLF